MAVTEAFYTGNGSTVLYSIPFPYIDAADVKVTVSDVPTTAFTFANASTIQFTNAPSIFSVIRIYRETNVSQVPAQFFPGSSIKADNLNDNFEQILFVTQETQNNFATSFVYGASSPVTYSNSTTAQSIFGKKIALQPSLTYEIQARMGITVGPAFAPYYAHNIYLNLVGGYGAGLHHRARFATVPDCKFGSAGQISENLSGGFYGDGLTVTGPTTSGNGNLSLLYTITGRFTGSVVDQFTYPSIQFLQLPLANYSLLPGSYIKISRIPSQSGTWVNT